MLRTRSQFRKVYGLRCRRCADVPEHLNKKEHIVQKMAASSKWATADAIVRIALYVIAVYLFLKIMKVDLP